MLQTGSQEPCLACSMLLSQDPRAVVVGGGHQTWSNKTTGGSFIYSFSVASVFQNENDQLAAMGGKELKGDHMSGWLYE